MKLAWNENWMPAIRKSKFALLALSLGLAMGYTAGQMIHSQAETESMEKKPQATEASSATPVPVHTEKSKSTDKVAEMDAAVKKLRDSMLSWNPHSSLFCPWWLANPYNADAVFRNLDMMSDFDRDWAFPSAWQSTISLPKLDTSIQGDEVKITAEVPGVETKNLDVTVNDDSVTIKGEKKEEISPDNSNKSNKIVERSYGSFERKLSLPCRVQSDKAKALLKNGVLTVTIPKSLEDENQGRKLSIRNE